MLQFGNITFASFTFYNVVEDKVPKNIWFS